VRRRPILFLAGIVLVIAACGGDEEVISTTTTVSSATSSTLGVATTTVVTPTEATLSDLTGTWENSILTLEVNDGGEFLVLGGSGETLMGGFIARDGVQFNFVTSTTDECPGQTGVYEASIADEVLTLTLVDDPCELRASGFEDPFSTATG